MSDVRGDWKTMEARRFLMLEFTRIKQIQYPEGDYPAIKYRIDLDYCLEIALKTVSHISNEEYRRVHNGPELWEHIADSHKTKIEEKWQRKRRDEYAETFKELMDQMEGFSVFARYGPFTSGEIKRISGYPAVLLDAIDICIDAIDEGAAMP